MAYWGIAMSRIHDLGATPTEFQRARTLLKGKGISAQHSVKETTFRQSDVYKDSDKVDREPVRSHHEAMKRLHLSNPSDNEASIFYALLIATGMMMADRLT
jgi:hypothetical protein